MMNTEICNRNGQSRDAHRLPVRLFWWPYQFEFGSRPDCPRFGSSRKALVVVSDPQHCGLGL
jgi:hypothetical protein